MSRSGALIESSTSDMQGMDARATREKTRSVPSNLSTSSLLLWTGCRTAAHRPASTTSCSPNITRKTGPRGVFPAQPASSRVPVLLPVRQTHRRQASPADWTCIVCCSHPRLRRAWSFEWSTSRAALPAWRQRLLFPTWHAIPLSHRADGHLVTSSSQVLPETQHGRDPTRTCFAYGCSI